MSTLASVEGRYREYDWKDRHKTTQHAMYILIVLFEFLGIGLSLGFLRGFEFLGLWLFGLPIVFIFTCIFYSILVEMEDELRYMQNILMILEERFPKKE